MIYGAIEGMVASLGDPYTSFLPPDENKVVQEDLTGSFEGVGIQIGFKGTQLAVVAPLPGSPAEKAGIKAGDFIVGIKDEEKELDRGTVGISLPDAVKAIRGRSGSQITLALLRDGEESPILVDIVREKLDVPSLILSYVGENESIAHIRLLKFGGDTEEGWNKAVNEIVRKAVFGVILDLRNNPGGYLNVAIELGGDFVGKGTPIVIQENSDGTRNSFTSNGQGRFINVPVIVLVNEGSASASEILAATLREDRTDVTLVGKKTYGKGTVQEKKDLPDGSGVNITVAKWLTPKGTWVHKVGIMPDVEVTLTPEDITAQRDTQLMKALEIARGKIAGK